MNFHQLVIFSSILRCQTKHKTHKLTSYMDPPKIAGLPADASGISQIGSVLGPAIRELVMGDPREAPRRIKPESARARERRRARLEQGAVFPKQKRRKIVKRVPDEEFLVANSNNQASEDPEV